MEKLKSIDYKVLVELMKNSKISDRKLATQIGVSQPTVTRRRARLEQDGLIEYTAIPNLAKLGYEILAFSFSKWTAEAFTQLSAGEIDKQAHVFLSKHPSVIFGSTGGSGLGGMNAVCASIHKDYADYEDWVNELRAVWGKYVAEFESYLVSLKSDRVVRNITFKHFSQLIQPADE